MLNAAGAVIILAFEECKEVSFLKGEISLHCVIAPNGHVLPKKMDEGSKDRDIELAIFAPAYDGFLWKAYGTDYLPSHDFAAHGSTGEQKRMVREIMEQKGWIGGALQTIWVHSWSRGHMYLEGYKSTRSPLICPSIGGSDVAHVVGLKGLNKDCNFSSSDQGMLEVCYRADDFSFLFNISANNSRGWGFYGSDGRRANLYGEDILSWSGRLVAKSKPVSRWLPGAKLDFSPRIRFYAARAENGAFAFPGRGILRVVCGGWNIFQAFEIDDALLLLEKTERIEETIFHWTLYITENRHVRDMARVLGNNPCLADLLRGTTKSGEHNA